MNIPPDVDCELVVGFVLQFLRCCCCRRVLCRMWCTQTEDHFRWDAPTPALPLTDAELSDPQTWSRSNSRRTCSSIENRGSQSEQRHEETCIASSSQRSRHRLTPQSVLPGSPSSSDADSQNDSEESPHGGQRIRSGKKNKIMDRHRRTFREIVPDFPAAHYFNTLGHKKSLSNQVPFTLMNVRLIELMIRWS